MLTVASSLGFDKVRDKVDDKVGKDDEVHFQVGAVILGAGASTRMGRPKLLLPWGNTTVIGHLLNLWQRVGAKQIAVVVSYSSPAVVNEIERAEVGISQINNANPQLGMFESIRCAARWTGWKPGITHHAIVLGDQPLVQEATVAALLAFATQHLDNICQPSRNGRGRHPVIVPRHIFEKVESSQAQHLKDFLLAQPMQPARFESPDAGLDMDLDTPEDYQRALAIR